MAVQRLRKRSQYVALCHGNRARRCQGSKAKEKSEIIRIRTHRNGGAIAELHQQSMGIVGNKPVPYFLGMRCDIMKRQIKQFFAAWIKVK